MWGGGLGGIYGTCCAIFAFSVHGCDDRVACFVCSLFSQLVRDYTRILVAYFVMRGKSNDRIWNEYISRKFQVSVPWSFCPKPNSGRFFFEVSKSLPGFFHRSAHESVG